MQISRREFVRSVAAAGAGIAIAQRAQGQAAVGSAGDINVAIIGAGKQGMVLIQDAIKIPGIRFKAVCDIWSYSQRYASGRLKAYKHEANVYEDYREMLDKEKDIQAVIVATPDCFHAEQAIACLKAGKHVYCEKEMSNNLETAKNMVIAARETGKLLQIGHQRRSNPVYRHTLEMIDKDNICGRFTTCYGQWNRCVQDKLTSDPRYSISDETLKKYGYESMDHFRNWRWFKKYSSGPIADLGSHQIDIFSWFLHSEPKSVFATGGSDYYTDREWYGDVMAMYEYAYSKEGKAKSARAFYQVINTNSFGNYFERFGGDQGTVTITEDAKMCYYIPEVGKEVPAWMADVARVERNGYQVIPLVDAIRKKSAAGSAAMDEFDKKNVHQFHLENFFNAVRSGDKKSLTCPADVAYATCVAVLNVIPSIESGSRHIFQDGDFKA